MTLHLLLALERVPFPGLVHHDAIVEALAHQKSFAGVHGDDRHGMHRGIGNVLDWHADVPLPDQYLLVVAGGDHFGTVVFDEGYGIHGRQMMIVLLGDFARGGIVGDDLIVRASHHEEIIVMGIEFDDVRNASIGERSQNLAALDIPQPQVPIERRRDEPRTVVIELHVPDRRAVPNIRPHALAPLHAPNLARPIEPRAQQQMSRSREQSDAMHAPLVPREPRDALLGNEARVIVRVERLGPPDAGGGGRPGPAAIIHLLVPVEGRRGLERLGVLVEAGG
mmetsp:Transcript_36999/g.89197  ORF Transcript_36999/g.89197 Transcript_36999/m.89197 type:complete len:280 (-) Transcript_36999:480-1319(-)